jgi:outer membrane lipopolysaccharide assembly protein LptE/RlpB
MGMLSHNYWDTLLRKLPSLMAVLALVFGLTACGTVMKLAYNQLPTLAYHQLRESFDFNDAQTIKVREGLAAVHIWHRKNELPKYADRLKTLQNDLLKDTSAEQICSLYQEARVWFKSATEFAEPTMVAVALLYTADQLAEMQRKLDERNTKWRKDWIEGGRAKQIDKRTQSFVSNAKRIYGDLSADQIRLVKAEIAAHGFDSEITYTENLRRQKEGMALLQKIIQVQPTAQQAAFWLREYFERSSQTADPKYRAYANAMSQKSCELGAKLHNSTSAAQREQAVRKLSAHESDLRALAAQSS